MSGIVDVIIKSGLVPQDNLDELRRWGLPLPPREDDPSKEYKTDVAMTHDGLCQAIDQALQDQGYVLTRETDLDLVPKFLRTLRMSTLHMVNDDGKAFDTEIQVGLHSTGDYIIPWEGDSIVDLMTNGATYLGDGKERVVFTSARDIFFDQHKALMLCTPSTRESHGTPG